MSSKKRIKISKATEAQLLFKTDYKCCVCHERGDHIHHLDENPNNNNLDNLAFLCFNHHDLASLKGTLKKKLTQETIIKYREHHYKVIDKKRKQELHVLDAPIGKLTDEKLLTISKTAIIILELENLKIKYDSENLNSKHEVLYEILNKYRNHTKYSISLRDI